MLHNHDGVFVLKRTAVLKRWGLGEALSRDGAILAVATGNDVTLLSTAKLEARSHNPLLGHLNIGQKAGANYLALSLDNRLLFASDEGRHRISVFDFAKARKHEFKGNTLIGNIRTGASPVGLAFTPNGQWLFATSEVAPKKARLPKVCKPELKRQRKHAQGILMEINVRLAAKTPRRAMTSAVRAGCNPVRTVVSPSGKYVWVTARGSNELWRFNVRKLHAEPTKYQIEGSPVGLAVRPDGKQVWVAASARFGEGKAKLVGLREIADGTFGQPISITTRGFPRELRFLPDGRTLVVTLFAVKAVLFIRTRP